MLKILKCLVFILTLSSLVACTANPGQESTGEFIDSSTSTTKIKAQLIDALGTKAFAIQVKTYKEEVQLSGFVNSPHLKKRAGIIAAGNADVKRVRNDLIVK